MVGRKKGKHLLEKTVHVRISASLFNRMYYARKKAKSRILKGELPLEYYRELSDELRQAAEIYTRKLEDFVSNGHPMNLDEDDFYEDD